MMTCRNLLFTVLACLLVYSSVAQRVTDILISGLPSASKGIRLTSVDSDTSDTSFHNIFSESGPGAFKARVSLSAPALMNLTVAGINTMLFLAPGFNLNIRFTDSAGGKQLLLSGPGAKLNNAYKSFSEEYLGSYADQYNAAKGTSRIELMSEKLKLTDEIGIRQLRDYFCFLLIGLSIDSCADVFQLNENKLAWQKYFTAIADPYFRKDLDDRYAVRLDSFLTAMNGRPAPEFVLYDPTGKRHSFDEFAGKVIYIDFWASWCAPCRVESGYLKKLKKEYTGEKNIAFVGIAIADINWERAILEDKPDWLQLRDGNGKVAAAYGVAGLPRYVLIGKDGKVADHNAPAPSNKDQLKTKIDKLLQE